MAVQLKRQGVENAASCSDSPLKPEGLSYGEPAIDSSGYIYVGNGQGKVVSLTRFSDKSLSSSYSENSLHAIDSDALSGKKIGTGIFNSTTEFIPYVKNDGGLEIGNYIDFHEFENSSVDYNLKLTCDEHALKITDQNKNYGRIYLGNLFICTEDEIASLDNCKMSFKNNSSILWSIGVLNNNLIFSNPGVDTNILNLSDKVVTINGNTDRQPLVIDSSNSTGAEIVFKRKGIKTILLGEGSGSGVQGTFGVFDAVNSRKLLYSDTNGYCHAIRMYNAVYNDYAELFPRGENTEPGDIIALDINSEKELYIKATASSKKIVGVHSNEYGHLIGGEEPPSGQDFMEYNIKKYIPVGLVGRCRVKILGKVCKGDDIVPSDIPGIGKVWKENEDSIDLLKNSIGFAVENSNNDGIKLIKIKLRG